MAQTRPSDAPAAPRSALLLAVVAQDATFVRANNAGQAVWLGRCLHCQAKLVVHLDGSAPPNTTLEHIVPQQHGGSDALENLGLACRRCNHLKGARIDKLPSDHPAYQKTIQQLQAQRAQRHRQVFGQRPIDEGRSSCRSDDTGSSEPWE